MDLTTPALLFPAISLLLLAYTNRFLTLAQVIRQLHASPGRNTALVMRQIPGLKRRIVLIQYRQSFGVLSFLLAPQSTTFTSSGTGNVSRARNARVISICPSALTLSAWSMPKWRVWPRQPSPAR